MPLSVTEAGRFAFENCAGLTEFWIDSVLYSKTTGLLNNCKNVKVKNYSNAAINTVRIVGNIEYTVTWPETNGTGTVKVTGYDPQATKIVIPAVVEIMGAKYKVTALGANRYIYGGENNTLKTVVIGANVLSIDDRAFSRYNELLSVTGGARIRSIGTRAFEKCPKLKVVSITSKTLWRIGPFAFALDKNLKTLQVKKTTKLIKSGVKNSLKGSAVKTVKVKKAKVKKYKKIFKKKNCGKKVKVKK